MGIKNLMNKTSSVGLSPAVQVSDPESEAYYRRIDQCAKGQLDILIGNGLPQHAEYLMRWLIKQAKLSVKIYSGSLMASTNDGTLVFGSAEMIDAALRLLKNSGSKLSVIVQKADNYLVNPFVQALQTAKIKGEIFGSFELLQLNQNLQQNFQKHFLINDVGGFRVETDHVKTTAVANFNDASISASLIERFDIDLMPHSKQLIAF